MLPWSGAQTARTYASGKHDNHSDQTRQDWTSPCHRNHLRASPEGWPAGIWRPHATTWYGPSQQPQQQPLRHTGFVDCSLHKSSKKGFEPEPRAAVADSHRTPRLYGDVYSAMRNMPRPRSPHLRAVYCPGAATIGGGPHQKIWRSDLAPPGVLWRKAGFNERTALSPSPPPSPSPRRQPRLSSADCTSIPAYSPLGAAPDTGRKNHVLNLPDCNAAPAGEHVRLLPIPSQAEVFDFGHGT